MTFGSDKNSCWAPKQDEFFIFYYFYIIYGNLRGPGNIWQCEFIT